jgi:Tfp pilus assembly protein PilF
LNVTFVCFIRHGIKSINSFKNGKRYGMKSYLLLLFSLFVVFNAAGQEDSKKLMRNAKRALNSYYLDPNGNKDKLFEAKDQIDKAMADNAFAQTFDANYEKGKIYAELANFDALALSMNPTYKSTEPDAALKAHSAYEMAYKVAEKGFQKKDALKGIAENLTGLNTVGYDAFQKGDQSKAFLAFEGILNAHFMLTENKEKSPLSTEEDVNNQIFSVAYTAYASGKHDKAEKYFNQLLDRGYERPDVYNTVYQMMLEKGDEEKASKYLKRGREKFPEDVTLLFSEINEALRKGKLDELISRLKEAIEKEPENVSLYTTLGNVYDNLYQNAEDVALKQAHFDNAKKYYEVALSKSPEYFDAVYSLGALFYNKAAVKTKELNVLADDYTKAGIEKYQTKKKEVEDIFKLALPHFLKAEKINDKDKNTLVALREIYARLNEIEKSNQYKARIDALDK